MQTILCMNAKGGCGKTTLATNLASGFAASDWRVALADCDPQRSSLDWLGAREDYENIGAIQAVDALAEGGLRVARGTEVLIIDAPAGAHGKDMTPLLRRADVLLVPVLPSPIDMRAAARYIGELHTAGRIVRGQTRVALVENRVRERSRIFHVLEDFLDAHDIPVLTHLRDSQAYLRAAETGLGIFELPTSQAGKDVDLWHPIYAWLARA